ncbi:L-threonylcarbamoyladenylate synthase [Mesomycoplasma neurolyticum]|uniref:L-threonylcarbamoyladenylate synthase n=1 Tax=Mesomycoplasma neurolyticum TaxID=2120 RepID=A0A449A5V7_9BACT|nr:Sua5/YciO/YrdC/YwlC family protein [Mesomycoplasma neurolyticum]VEU59670.1 Putative translation factor (SUA5) [Mesomycoplasma neurolyticum]
MNNKKNDEYKNLFITTTDTVVGLGVPVISDELELLFKVKSREINKKIIILVASIEQARFFKQWNAEAEKMALKFWPGNTTLIVNDQGFRMPKCTKLLKLLEEKGACFVTSANISGEKTLDFENAINKFPMIKQRYNLCQGSGVASKIIRVENKEVIRYGE